MSTAAHTEHAFERLIVRELTTVGGWLGEDTARAPTEHRGYDVQLSLYPDDLIAFIRETQSHAWDKLVDLAGSEHDARVSLLRRVAAQLDKRGTIAVLRGGLTEKGVPLRLAYFEPDLEVEPTARLLYEANGLRVVRQVRFDPNSGDSVDLVLFVNGVPTATAELKNRYTGQTVDDAILQYRGRPAPNLLLGRRAFVHFALDADLAYMTTRLEGRNTRFLPFNQGSGGAGNPGGAGTRVAGGRPPDGVRVAVGLGARRVDGAHREVRLRRAARHQRQAQARATGGRVPALSSVARRPQLRGPRPAHGPGHSYLIQHSAGSGKSKEIAWLAHDLSTVHGEDRRPVFEKVIVITDRQVLDRQLQAQVKAFEQVPGRSARSTSPPSSCARRSRASRRGSSSPRCRSSRSCSAS